MSDVEEIVVYSHEWLPRVGSLWECVKDEDYVLPYWIRHRSSDYETESLENIVRLVEGVENVHLVHHGATVLEKGQYLMVLDAIRGKTVHNKHRIETCHLHVRVLFREKTGDIFFTTPDDWFELLEKRM